MNYFLDKTMIDFHQIQALIDLEEHEQHYGITISSTTVEDKAKFTKEKKWRKKRKRRFGKPKQRKKSTASIKSLDVNQEKALSKPDSVSCNQENVVCSAIKTNFQGFNDPNDTKNEQENSCKIQMENNKFNKFQIQPELPNNKFGLFTDTSEEYLEVEDSFDEEFSLHNDWGVSKIEQKENFWNFQNSKLSSKNKDQNINQKKLNEGSETCQQFFQCKNIAKEKLLDKKLLIKSTMCIEDDETNVRTLKSDNKTPQFNKWIKNTKINSSEQKIDIEATNDYPKLDKPIKKNTSYVNQRNNSKKYVHSQVRKLQKKID